MKSAIRWYRDAVTGKLGRLQGHAALDRCVLRRSKDGRGGYALPAGLSALSRGRPVNQASWSGVPVRASSAAAMSAGVPEHLWADAGLPRSAAVVGMRPVLASAKSSRSPQAQAATSKPSNVSKLGAPTSRWSEVARGFGRQSAMAADSLIVNRRGVGRSSLIVPVAAAGPRSTMEVVAKAPLVMPAMIRVPPTMPAALRPALTMPQQQPAGDEKVAGSMGMGFSEPAVIGPAGLPSISKKRALSVSSATNGSNPMNAMLRASGTTQSAQGVAPAGTALATSSLFMDAVNSLAIGRPGAPQTAFSALPDGISESANGSSFRDQATSGQDIVPRKAGISARSSNRTEARDVAQRSGRASAQDGAGSTGEMGRALADPASSRMGQGTQAGMTVAVHGDVMLDGRKLGRMVAAGQTSAASLPTVSASAVNLRAIPVFAGTRAPL